MAKRKRKPKWLPPKTPVDSTNPFLVQAQSTEGWPLFKHETSHDAGAPQDSSAVDTITRLTRPPKSVPQMDQALIAAFRDVDAAADRVMEALTAARNAAFPGEDGNSITDPWIAAFRDIDNAEKRDPRQLLDLLRSKYPMNDASRTYLADLIERHVVRSPGTQKIPKIPANTANPADQAKIKAAAKVRTLVNGKERMRLAKALEKVCEEEGVPYVILKNFYEGRS
jgi:hypothetical protein